MDYDDTTRTSGPTVLPALPVQQKSVRQPGDAAPGQLQRRAEAAQALVTHTLRPVAAQRQQVGGMMAALEFQRADADGPRAEPVDAQCRADVAPGPTPTTPAAGPGPAGVRTPADWLGLARSEVQRVEDPAQPGQTRWMSGAERERHLGILRSVGQGLARGFRADRGPAVQRYAEYGDHLATLQRQPLTRGIPGSVLAQLSPSERPLLQRALDEALQRQSEQEKRHEEEGEAQAGPPVAERIEARRGGGQPLSADVRRALEAGLNHDLSGVRVHTDAEAHLMARKVNAVAFTTGRDIYFQAGRFAPDTRSGAELLAHEAAHVRQQAQGQVVRGLDPDAGLEAEARAFGAKFAGQRRAAGAGQSKAVTVSPGAGPGAAQRMAVQRQAASAESAMPARRPAGAVPLGGPSSRRPSPAPEVKVTAQHPPRRTEIPARRRLASRSAAGVVKRPPAAEVRPARKTVRLPDSGGALKAHAAKAASAMKGTLAAQAGPGPAGRPAIKVRPVKAAAVKAGAAVFAKPQLDKAQLRAAGVDPAQALRAAEKRRTQSSALVSAFMKRGSAKSKTVQGLAKSLSGQVQGAARTAKRNVQAASVKHASVLRSGVAAARARATTQAGAATTQLKAHAQTALSALPKTTRAANAKLTAAHAKEVQQLKTQASAQKAAVRAAFQSGATRYRAAGTQVGGEAMSHAEARASGYLSHVTGKDDSFLDGPVTDNRWKARADAARQVGQSYQKGYADEGQNQATTLLGGMNKDLDAIEETTQAALSGLSTQMKAAQQKLTADEARARTQVQQAQAQMAQAVQAQLRAVLAQLASSEGAGLAAISHAAASQGQALDSQAAQAGRSLQRSVDQIAQQLDRTLSTFGASVRGSQAPDPAALRKALAGAERQIDKMVTGARAQLSQGLHQVTGGLASGAAAAQSGIAAMASSGAAQAKQTSASFGTSSQALVRQALATLTQLQHGYEQSSTASVQQTQEAFTAAGKGLSDLFEKARSGLDGKIGASVEALIAQLRQNFSQLDAAIDAQAEKAAAQVQPRWKGWAKIALMVAVIIVVAVVAGPLVIGAVGAMAGALGAGAAAGAIGMVVGGAVVGAAAGAVTQIGNNAIDNVGVAEADRKSLFDGVGKAALIGAVGGAVGGAGGAVAQGLGKAGALGAGALTQKVAGFGVSTAFDLGGNVAGSMATGTSLTDSLKSLTSPENLMLMAIGTGVGLSTAKLPGSVGKVQAGAHNMGERFGTHVGEGIANTSGYRGAPVPTRVNPELTSNTAEISGYGKNRVQVEHAADVHPKDLAVHTESAQTARKETSLPGKISETTQRLLGHPSEAPGGSRKWELQTEANKHDAMAQWRETEAAQLPSEHPQRQKLNGEAQALREQAAAYREQSSRTPADVAGEGSIFHKNESVWNKVRTDSPEALQGLKNDYDIYMRDGEPALRQKSRTVTAQKMEFVKNADGTFSVKPSNDVPLTLKDKGIDPASAHDVKNRQIWETTEKALVDAYNDGTLPPEVQARLKAVLDEDLTRAAQDNTPLADARQRVVARLNEAIGEGLSQSRSSQTEETLVVKSNDFDTKAAIENLRAVLKLVRQPGTQGSIAEHLAGRLYLDPDYVKSAFKDGEAGLALLERQQIIVDSFKADGQHGVEFKSGYESGQVDVNQAKNYVELIDKKQMQQMDYLIMPSAKSSPAVAAENIVRALSVDENIALKIESGEININYVDDEGNVIRIGADGSRTKITLRR